MSRRPRRLRSEAGQAGGLEALVFGVLLFVAGTLVVASVWGAIDAKFAADQAAREAARAFVETGADATTADQAARAAATAALAGHHRADGAEVAMTGDGYRRCGRVTYRVTVRVPVLVAPFLARSVTGFRISSVHSELVDPYRSSLAGTADCG